MPCSKKRGREFRVKLLEIDSISKNFGGLAALVKVSFDVSTGQIVGVIGPNGAGKTTLFNCLSGIDSVHEGRIRYRDREINGLAPHQVVKRGLARTFQTTRIFEKLTVLENVMVGRHLHSRTNFFYDLFRLPKATAEERASRDSALRFLDLMKLSHLKAVQADQLTLAQARRMELARVLATSPDLLLLDEPGAGLDDREREDLKEMLMEVHDQGVTLMVIEHDIDLVAKICTELMVLNFGKLIAQGKSHEVLANKDVLDAYLGSADET